jgi:hypothetical protein
MTRNLITAVVLSIMIHGNVWSQATITAQAFAEVIEALTAYETEQLNFGRFSPELSGGNIVLTTDGSRIAQGSVILASGPHNPGKFTLMGAPEATFNILLPPGPAILTHQGSNKTMIVEDWMSDPPADADALTLPNGSRIISVGATLSVGPVEENPVGLYAGTFELTFSYN